MSTLLKPFSVQEKLLEKGMTVFTPDEFTRLFHATAYQRKYFLETYTQQGLLVRFKRGLYGVKTSLPDEQTLANRLYEPSYISFEYALAWYNMMPEAVYAITSTTTKPTRRFTVLGKTYIYHTVKRDAYTGYTPVSDANRLILMADREKALVDYLYLVSLGQKTLNDRLSVQEIDTKKLRAYAKLFRRPILEELIRKVAP
ncbi:MAG: hypothetical protein AAB557_02225 [Patescibacteria group bacterium]